MTLTLPLWLWIGAGLVLVLALGVLVILAGRPPEEDRMPTHWLTDRARFRE